MGIPARFVTQRPCQKRIGRSAWPSDSSRVEIRAPQTDAEFEAYFELRWRILRKPWGEARARLHGGKGVIYEEGAGPDRLRRVPDHAS